MNMGAEVVILFPLDIYPEMKLLDHMVVNAYLLNVRMF